MVAQLKKCAVACSLALLSGAAAWSYGGPARADGSFGAEARVKRPIVATHSEDGSASGSTVWLDDRVSPPRSLGDALREVPGARVTQTGGLGACSTLSLRGADDNETLVLLRDIPLLTPDGGAFDLSLLPVSFFGSVEVFRGGAPVWLNSGAIGGVVRLNPREAEATSMSGAAGLGSFGSFQLDAHAQVAERDTLTSRSSVVVRGTRGDYPYTLRDLPYAAGKGEERTRQNAEYLDANLFQELSFTLGKGVLRALVLAGERTGGFPGPGAKPTPQIQRRTDHALLALSYDLAHGRAGDAGHRRILLTTTGAYGRDRHTDLYGQLGVSRRIAADDDRYRNFTRLAGTLQLAPWLLATLTAAHALDLYRPEDAFRFPAPRPSVRNTLSAAAELAVSGRIFGRRFEVRPSVRAEWSSAKLHAHTSLGKEANFERELFAPTARLGALLELVRGLSLSTSVSTGVRLPSLYELFGDRGLVLASPDLRPVRSRSFDVGLTSLTRFQQLHALLELRGFVQERHDSIAMFRTSQWQVGHENLSRVRQRGAELAVSLQVGRIFALHASTTLLDATDALGRRLPLRARYVSTLRPELTWHFDGEVWSSVSVASELYQRSFVFVDVANAGYVQGCVKASLLASSALWRERVRVSARLDDVADVRCTDVVGYPLPGRSAFFTLEVRQS